MDDVYLIPASFTTKLYSKHLIYHEIISYTDSVFNIRQVLSTR